MPPTHLPEQPSQESRPTSSHWYTAIMLGLGFAGTALIVYLMRGDQTNNLGRLLTAWALWLPIALLSGTRTLWDKNFYAGGTRRQRIRRFLGEWVGITGLVVAAVAIAAIVILPADVFGPRAGYWLIPEIAVPVLLMCFKGYPRKIGTGLLIALAAPAWPYLLLGGIAILGPAAVVYLIAVTISASVQNDAPRPTKP